MDCRWLLIASELIQLVGLVVLVWHIGRLQRGEGPPKFLQRLKAFFGRTKEVTYTDTAMGGVSASGNVEASGTVTRANESVDERLTRLERRQDDLGQRLIEQRRARQRDKAEAGERISAVEADLANQGARFDQALRTERRETIRFQVPATAAFIVAVVAGVFGNLLPC